MDLKIISDTNEELQYSITLPETLNTLLLPGAENLFVNGDYGSMLFQHIPTAENNIWVSSYFMHRTASFKSYSAEPFLELHFTWKNNIRYTIKGIGHLEMMAKQFNITYLPYLESKTFFHPGDFQTFDVHITPAFLNKAALYYPRVNEFLNVLDKHAASRLSKINHFATGPMLVIIQQIKSCCLQGALREFYIDTKVTELLVLVLDAVMNHPVWQKIKLKPYDIECLREAKKILLDNMENPYSVVQLAHKAGINDFKLKKGFKQVFGTTVFDCLFNARMEESLRLLKETNVPIFEIAYIIGYRNSTAFSAAFRKKFGYPPSFIRKQ
jgi:AraC family transcriptional activator of pyochelin receptor